MSLPHPTRYTVFGLCVLLTVACIAAAVFLSPGYGIAAAVFALLIVVGVWDMIQTHHSIQKAYPVIGHIRWMVELVRPELRQYPGIGGGRRRRAVLRAARGRWSISAPRASRESIPSAP